MDSSSSSSSCEIRPKRLRPPSYLSSHMTKKLPIAPMPPTPPKIYKVHPIHFKEAVQMLTAQPGFRSSKNSRRLLDEVAPPPPPKTTVLPESGCGDDDNNVSEWKKFLSLSGDVKVSDVLRDRDDDDIVTETLEDSNNNNNDSLFGEFNVPPAAVGFAPLSPSSLAWWASVLPSPGTLPQPHCNKAQI